MADPATAPVVRRHGFLALIIAGACVVLMGTFVLLWLKLPAWAPEWVVSNSPFLDPLLRMSLEKHTYENRVRGRIVAWGPEITPALLARLGDQRAPIRELAVSCLGELRDARAVPALMALATADPEPEVVREAVDALGRIGDRSALPTLVSLAVSSPVPAVSHEAIEALGDLGDVRALQPLLGLMRRRGAPWFLIGDALTQLPNDAVTTAILPLPPGEGDEVQAMFEIARRLDDPRAVAALDQALREGPAEVCPSGRWFALTSRGDCAASSLVHSVHASAIPTLVAAFSDPRAHVRRRAAAGIVLTNGNNLDVRLIPPLRAALQDPAPEVRQTVAFACRFVRVEGAEPVLLAMLADPDPLTRYFAAIGLGNAWASTEAIARLAALLGDGEIRVRRAAVSALGKSENRAALDALLAAIPGADEPLCQRIIEALASSAYAKDPRVFPWLLRLLADPLKSRHELALRVIARNVTMDEAQRREYQRVMKAWVEVKPAEPPTKPAKSRVPELE